MGQVALASIRNAESLIAAGNNNFQASAKTALPAIGLPETGGRISVYMGDYGCWTIGVSGKLL